MNNDLNKDQKIKLKKLFEKKDYAGFEQEVEKLGKIENLPAYLIMGYAGSKTLNFCSCSPTFSQNAFLDCFGCT